MIVEVYFNLHKNLFSVRHEGRVIDHTHKIMLRDAKFVVQPGGRARVLREGRKNVHAWVKGEMIGDIMHHNCCHRIVYNPYKYESFVDKGENPVYEAERVFLRLSDAGTPKIMAGGVYAKNP